MPTRSFASHLPLLALAALTTLSACGGAESDSVQDSNDPGDAGRRRRVDAAQPAADAEVGGAPGADGATPDAEAPAPDALTQDGGLIDATPPDPSDAAADAAPPADAAAPVECNGQAVIDLRAALAGTNSVLGTTSGAPARLAASCGGAAGGEVVYAYDLDRPLDRLTLSTVSEDTTSR